MGAADDEIKNKIHNAIDKLPSDKLELVVEFLEDLLQGREEETARLMREIGYLEEVPRLLPDHN